MARSSRTIGKNKWALFLLILVGIVLGSFIGYLLGKIEFLSWLDYGIDFAIGNPDSNNIVSLDLGALVVHFGLRIKITVASVIGAITSIFIYKKL
ncbi:MAG: DUF4321 domain-containing protein [Clostridiales bacterium]|nr:DUF4321 domain-containing protein [Clostridiales bacterium]